MNCDFSAKFLEDVQVITSFAAHVHFIQIKNARIFKRYLILIIFTEVKLFNSLNLSLIVLNIINFSYEIFRKELVLSTCGSDTQVILIVPGSTGEKTVSAIFIKFFVAFLFSFSTMRLQKTTFFNLLFIIRYYIIWNCFFNLMSEQLTKYIIYELTISIF